MFCKAQLLILLPVDAGAEVPAARLDAVPGEHADPALSAAPGHAGQRLDLPACTTQHCHNVRNSIWRGCYLVWPGPILSAGRCGSRCRAPRPRSATAWSCAGPGRRERAAAAAPARPTAPSSGLHRYWLSLPGRETVLVTQHSGGAATYGGAR